MITIMKIYQHMCVILLCGCMNNKTLDGKALQTANYVDSICEVAQPILGAHIERVSADEYVMRDTTRGKHKMWQYADSLDKYCSSDNLKQLAGQHVSNAVRLVAFKKLLKRSPHDAIEILINDIDNPECFVVTRLDEGFPETLTSLRVEIAQDRNKYNITVEDSIALDNAVLKSSNKHNINYYPYLFQKLLEKDTNQ